MREPRAAEQSAGKHSSPYERASTGLVYENFLFSEMIAGETGMFCVAEGKARAHPTWTPRYDVDRHCDCDHMPLNINRKTLRKTGGIPHGVYTVSMECNNEQATGAGLGNCKHRWVVTGARYPLQNGRTHI